MPEKTFIALGRLVRRCFSVPGALAVWALAGGLLFVAVSQGEPAAHPTAMYSAGGLSIFNSKSGGAIFSSGPLVPGESTTGTVTIGNTGRGSGQFFLSTTSLSETAGSGGGLLSQRLALVVTDVSDPAHPVSVYQGLLSQMQDVRVGTLRAGELRDYRFVVTFLDPGGALADAAYSNARLRATFSWTAT
jgi:hypothetical protein